MDGSKGKEMFEKAVGQATLTLDQLQTLFTETKAIVNFRPLTYVYDDAEDLSYTRFELHNFTLPSPLWPENYQFTQ